MRAQPIKSKSTEEVLSELEILSHTPGYIYVISYLCFRDNMVLIAPIMLPESLEHIRSSDRLIRPEISTVIGLMIKAPVDYTLPDIKSFTNLIETTEALLLELHDALNAPMLGSMFSSEGVISKDPFSSAEALREPIFYTGESAYSFQYSEFAKVKYRNDEKWLQTELGFSIEEAVMVGDAIIEIQGSSLPDAVENNAVKTDETPNFLQGLMFTSEEIISITGLSSKTVSAVLDTFTLPKDSCNSHFKDIGDFNQYKSQPLIQGPNGEYICIQQYVFMEAIYESPFYWMIQNKKYRNKATINRGDFCEEFIATQFSAVFGSGNVIHNVNIDDSKGNRLGEIDVLVILSDRALIIQAKSKRLTLAAQKGNDQALKADFQGAIQDACTQGYNCAKHIDDPTIKLSDADGNEINIRRNFKEIGVMCVVSDHYPSLSFQARQLLEFDKNSVQLSPFVTDIFFIDVLCEFLNEPYRIFHYLWKRMKYYEKVMATCEISVLSYHLQNNLWFDDMEGFIVIDDSISVELDSSFMCRKLGLEGKTVPDGILTRYQNSEFESIINHSFSLEQDGCIDLAFLLLDLSEEAVKTLNSGIKRIDTLSQKDGRDHDFSYEFKNTGLIIHTVQKDNLAAAQKMSAHCLMKKYKTRSDECFGLMKVVNSNEPFTHLLYIHEEWKYDPIQESILKSNPLKPKESVPLRPASSKKIGRNAKCPCNSGKKYKKCCGK